MQRWGNPIYVFIDFSSDHIRGFFQLALPAEHQYKHTITQHSPEKPFPHVELLIHDVKDRWSNIALKPVSINTNKRLWVYIYSWMCSSSWWCSWEVLVERPWLVLVFVVCVQSICVYVTVCGRLALDWVMSLICTSGLCCIVVLLFTSHFHITFL